MNTSTDKFKALVHYVIANCEDPAKLGAIRLNKILWYSDLIAFRETGNSISGSKYLRRQKGPVPARILYSLDQLESEGLINVQDPTEKYQPRLFTSLADPNDGLFSESEKERVNMIAKVICNGYSADAISQLSHDDVYNAAAEGEEIPLEATLIDQEGNYRSEVMSWADTVVQNLKQHQGAPAS